jgi:23S rRNA (adenine2503-C2)-methyltransferase
VATSPDPGSDAPPAPGPAPRPGLYDLDRAGVAALLGGEPRFRADQLWDGLYRLAAPVGELTALPASLRSDLASRFPPTLTERQRQVTDGGETTKWLFALADGHPIETVLMHYPRRTTVCVSSQAGCAMACGFCATGQAGFTRNLSTAEILEQVVVARRAAAPRRVDNIVFMGMGEPMANLHRTWEAIIRIHADMGLSARSITVSTVGIIPGIRRLATLDLPVNLAVSLHAANDDLRNELVPINRRYPLDDLMEACGEWIAAKRRRLSFEWALMDGVNDTPGDAEGLARRAIPLGAHVNLIPLNPTGGFATRGTPPERVASFCADLRQRGVNATVRANRGTDIAAACGQLAGTATPVAAPQRR